MKKNYKLTISYDGSRYYGWEHQKSTAMTIQGKLEAVLTAMLSGGVPDEGVPADADGAAKSPANGAAKPSAAKSPADHAAARFASAAVDVIGAGRTDAGVHAKAMTASVQLDTPLSEAEIRDYLNRYLPDDIGVTDVRTARDRFHARYSAVGKTYCYSCWIGENKPVFERKYLLVLEKTPDLARMQEAAALLTGTHDYKSFCGNPRMKKSTVRELYSVDFEEDAEHLRIFYHGEGFLQYLVRILTGTLIEVGLHRRDPATIPQLLAGGKRADAGFTAPAKGLCLIKVDYNRDGMDSTG